MEEVVYQDILQLKKYLKKIYILQKKSFLAANIQQQRIL